MIVHIRTKGTIVKCPVMLLPSLKQLVMTDYCGLGPFSSTSTNLRIFISLLKEPIWFIH